MNSVVGFVVKTANISVYIQLTNIQVQHGSQGTLQVNRSLKVAYRCECDHDELETCPGCKKTSHPMSATLIRISDHGKWMDLLYCSKDCTGLKCVT